MTQPMDQFDFVIIGAGAGGEAAAFKARRRGASVAIVDRDLFGGSCPFWACMPSKTLLHAAGVRAVGGDYDWRHAAARRDYMINREDRDYPDDSGHVKGLEKAGATVIRGEAHILGSGRVQVRTVSETRELTTKNIVVATGSVSKIPDLEGLADVHPWTNRDATSTEDLPASLLVLGGGPTGVELAQVFARYGVPTVVVEHNHRLLARDHPRNSAAVEAGLTRDGVTIRTGVRAVRARAHAGQDGAHIIDLDDGTTATGHEVMVAIGRDFRLAGLGLESLGIDPSKRDGIPHDGRLRIADGLFIIGDPAGPELHTHVAHYQGEMAVRMALGDDIRPDYRALPRATYTDPEAAFVGVSLEEAQAAGSNAFELVQDLATTAKGYVAEASGHVTIVVDRASRTLLGAAMAGPAASEVIHEAVLAIKTSTPIDVLADTIHAFPTAARVLGSLFAEAADQLV